MTSEIQLLETMLMNANNSACRDGLLIHIKSKKKKNQPTEPYPFRRVGTVTHGLPGHSNNLHYGELEVPKLLEGIRLGYIKTNLPLSKEGTNPFFNSPPPPIPMWWT
uniref:Uncharacterized protein n=1 Tax=Micrurus paraensis TaxID=1970185 RepID=A0A2D4KNI0_9SAUR